MAEVKKNTEPLAAPPTVEQKPAKLAPAAASGDAGVQFLLAQRSTHTSNGDDERTAEIDRQLAELGFTAQ